MCSREFITTMAVMLSMNGMLSGGVVPGRWEKVAAENPGTSLIVTMKSTERVEGSLKQLSDDTFTLTTVDGLERVLRKSDVARIVSGEKRSGPLLNGVVIGAAIGAALGLITYKYSVQGWAAGYASASTAFGAGIGAGLGLAIDAGYKGHVTLYQAPKDQSGP